MVAGAGAVAVFRLVRDELRQNREELRQGREEARRAAAELREEVAKRFGESQLALADTLQGVTGQLKDLQEGNERKLDQMRQTVDEKLQGTLEKRLGESFKLVSDRLEAVQRGLGEMQSLATGVGDLKRVLTNVKTRGTFGEVQLGAILEQILTPDQYGRNVRPRPDSRETVEFAVRLPGPESARERPCWLPIDAKFPHEDYARLLDGRRGGRCRRRRRGAGVALGARGPARRPGDPQQVRRAAAHDRLRDPVPADRRPVRRGAAPAGSGRSRCSRTSA